MGLAVMVLSRKCGSVPTARCAGCTHPECRDVADIKLRGLASAVGAAHLLGGGLAGAGAVRVGWAAASAAAAAAAGHTAH